MKTPYRVEIRRDFTRIEWGYVIIYADSEERALELAKPIAQRANDGQEVSSLIDFLSDDGTSSDWEVHEHAVPATEEELEFTDEDCIIEEPA